MLICRRNHEIQEPEIAAGAEPPESVPSDRPIGLSREGLLLDLRKILLLKIDVLREFERSVNQVTPETSGEKTAKLLREGCARALERFAAARPLAVSAAEMLGPLRAAPEGAERVQPHPDLIFARALLGAADHLMKAAAAVRRARENPAAVKEYLRQTEHIDPAEITRMRCGAFSLAALLRPEYFRRIFPRGIGGMCCDWVPYLILPDGDAARLERAFRHEERHVQLQFIAAGDPLSEVLKASHRALKNGAGRGAAAILRRVAAARLLDLCRAELLCDLDDARARGFRPMEGFLPPHVHDRRLAVFSTASKRILEVAEIHPTLERRSEEMREPSLKECFRQLSPRLTARFTETVECLRRIFAAAEKRGPEAAERARMACLLLRPSQYRHIRGLLGAGSENTADRP